jgi:predicted nucleotide-binding protein (sugar kinase/HSP70/actin superfamily)
MSLTKAIFSQLTINFTVFQGDILYRILSKSYEKPKERNKYLFKRWITKVKRDLHYTDFDEAHKYWVT